MLFHRIHAALLVSLAHLAVTNADTPAPLGSPRPKTQNCFGGVVTHTGAEQGGGCGNLIMTHWGTFNHITTTTQALYAGRCKITIQSTCNKDFTIQKRQYWAIFQQIEENCAKDTKAAQKVAPGSVYTGHVNKWEGSIDGYSFTVQLDEGIP